VSIGHRGPQARRTGRERHSPHDTPSTVISAAQCGCGRGGAELAKAADHKAVYTISSRLRHRQRATLHVSHDHTCSHAQYAVGRDFRLVAHRRAFVAHSSTVHASRVGGRWEMGWARVVLGAWGCTKGGGEQTWCRASSARVLLSACGHVAEALRRLARRRVRSLSSPHGPSQRPSAAASQSQRSVDFRRRR